MTFEGWHDRPFAASATRLRLVYHGAGAGRAEFVAEALPGGEVRLTAAGRPPIRSGKVSVRLGGAEVKYVATKPK